MPRFFATAAAIGLILAATHGRASDWEPLYDRYDADFQAALESRLDTNKQWRSLIRGKKMAVCLVDMNEEAPRFARVNGNHMMYAASLPKIAILLGAYASFEDGSLTRTDENRADLDSMIRVSSNAAATRMMDKVGMEKIQAVLQDPQYGLYDRKRGGGLWVGKRYAKDGPRKGDPLYGISHGATATQVCRFFYLLATEKLISRQRSREMLEHLVDPRLHHKFVSQLDERAPEASVYRKSGSWRRWHADAVLVKGQRWRNYVLVGLVEHQNGEQILRQLLPAVEELMVPPEFADGFDD